MKKRVLIVDDDMQFNKINEKILNASGLVAELHISRSGCEAINYLVARAEKNYPLPHFIIFELKLPHPGGFAFVDAFQALDITGKQGIELVVFTSSSNPKDQRLAAAKGIRHYLNKPYLLRGLRGIMTSPQSEQRDAFTFQHS